mmetsp:Transcript_105254/g.293012  ORF Transcript_105254/g.293012 Transcript_105254/m.293012 type:complete len:88 (+) Transcript_105254:227-490(+)
MFAAARLFTRESLQHVGGKHSEEAAMMSQALSGLSREASSMQVCVRAHCASVAQVLGAHTGRSVQLFVRASLRSVKALAVVQQSPAL